MLGFIHLLQKALGVCTPGLVSLSLSDKVVSREISSPKISLCRKTNHQL